MPAIETAKLNKVRPFEGTVTARLSDGLLASTTDALVAEMEGEEVFLFPFDDIYFDFLRRSPSRPKDADDRRDWWDASAVGEGRQHVMWSVDQLPTEIGDGRRRGCFDARAIRIDAHPEEHGENSPDFP